DPVVTRDAAVTAEDDSGFARRTETQDDRGCGADPAEVDRGMACPGESAIVTVGLSQEQRCLSPRAGNRAQAEKQNGAQLLQSQNGLYVRRAPSLQKDASSFRGRFSGSPFALLLPVAISCFYHWPLHPGSSRLLGNW